MMKHFVGLFILFLLASTATQAQHWEIYAGDMLPEEVGFKSNGGSVNAVLQVIDDPEIEGNQLLYFLSPDPSSQFSFTYPQPSDINDITLAMRIKGLPDVDTLVRLFDLDVRLAGVNLREKLILDYDNDVKFERSGGSAIVESIKDWHIWRFVCSGSTNEWAVYVDESTTPLIETASPAGSGDQYFKLGDGSGGNSMGALIDWVVWDTTGAFTPAANPLPELSGVAKDSAEIAFLTKLDWLYYDTYGYYADSLFVADLKAQGYKVNLLDYTAYQEVTPEEATNLEAADLVIIGRGVSSGDFDDLDDVIWAQLRTPVMLMSNYVARANRLAWVGSNDLQDFARLDTFYAEISKPEDAVFSGINLPVNGLMPYAVNNLGAIVADEADVNGEVLLRLQGPGQAYRVDNATGTVTDSFELADYGGNVLMVRWAPGDSMYLNKADLPGFASVVPNGYRSYVTVGHDREYDATLGTRIRDYYVFTDFSRQVWLNEIANLIDLSQGTNDEDTNLSTIEIDGVPIEFEPNDTELSYSFLAGTQTTHQPRITATAAVAGASVEITQPLNATAAAGIKVTSPSGTSSKDYTLDLSIRNGEGLVIFVTNKAWLTNDTYGAYADSLFVADLQNAGFDVYVAPYEHFADVDAMESKALEMADLIILGRGISSGDFDDPDDAVWANVQTPIILMSNYVARANRLAWIGSNDLQDFARVDTFSAEVSAPTDPIFAGVTIPETGGLPYAYENLGVVLANDSYSNGKSLLQLTGTGVAYRVDNATGMLTDSFELADYNGNILMSRWEPGVAMFTERPDLPGFTGAVPAGYRTYVTVGHDREYDTNLNTRLRDYYSLTEAGNTIWLNEANHLIDLAEEKPNDNKYALLSSISINGLPLTDFDPLDFEYLVDLPADSPIPTITFTNPYANAFGLVRLPASLSDTAYIEVNSGDAATTITYTLAFDVATNTHDPKLAGINIYPNPVREQLQIDIPAELGTATISIHTLLGQRVFRQKYNATHIAVPMEHLAAGVYYLRIEANHQSFIQKVVKE